MDKKKLIEQLKTHLEEELAALEQAANAAREAATHEESKPEDKYDTRGLEASYLAEAQSKRVEELKQLILMYRFLPVREYGPEDVACAGALVELEHNKTHAFYFLVSQGGGLVTNVDGKAVQVITPASPLGDELLGKREGDLVEVETRTGVREYRVISIR